MANLPEIEEFTAGIYQLETTDPVLGGPNGPDNAAAKALANRTKWLKARIDAMAVTPPQFDNDTSTATTAFVKRAMGSMQALVPIYANRQIVAADVGTAFLMGGTTSFTANLPATNGLPSGSIVKFLNITGVDMYVYGPAAGTIIIGSNGFLNITLKPGESIELITETNGWYAFSGSALTRYSPAYASSINTAGWKRTPDVNSPTGYLLRQWQALSVVNGAGIPFPVAFPYALLGIKITVNYGGVFAIAMPSNQSLSGFTLNHNQSGTALVYVESEGY
jgi:hypothetical protein